MGMKKIIMRASTAGFGLALLTAAMPALAATVNVCPINGNTGIFKATGPITVSDRVLSTPAFSGNPLGEPGQGPFWPAQ